MKLVEQVILVQGEGASERLFEIDLCEVGSERFVVNYRHGKRGKKLDDGSKTIMPVPEDEARRVFDRLVEQKLAGGYRRAGDLRESKAEPRPRDDRAPPVDGDPRAQAILRRLERATSASGWQIGRVAWRAGLMRLSAAEPYLLALLRKTNDPQIVYSLMFSLARCGSVQSIADLERERTTTPIGYLKRIATEALRAVVPEEHRSGAPFWEAQLDQIPKGLRDVLGTGAFKDELFARIEARDEATAKALYPLYVVGGEAVEKELAEHLRTLPIDRTYFPAIRAILKAAEVRSDGRMFGIIGRRIELGRTQGSYSYPATSRVFTRPTRTYLRRRVWRSIRKLAEIESPEYVHMAMGVLLAFTDEDARAPAYGYMHKWDRYASFWAFNQILYGKSARYRPSPSQRAFHCWYGFEPGAPAPAEREESFPELWDRDPSLLLDVLRESRCDVVHEFGARALRAQRRYLTTLSVGEIVMLLSRPYLVTAHLGYEQAQHRYEPTNPDPELVRAVVSCAFPPAREKAREWIQAHRLRFVEDTDLMAAVAASEHEDNRIFARDLLRFAILTEDKSRVLVARIIASMLAFGDADGPRAKDVGDTLHRCFARTLSTLGLDVVRDLIRHRVEAVEVFGGEVLLAHGLLARDVPEDVLIFMLDSPFASVRGIGARLLAGLSDTLLAARAHLVLHLSTHALPELRAGIRPAIARLALDPTFARSFVHELIRALMKDLPEGVPAHIVSILMGELAPALSHVDVADVWKLLQAKSGHAQELGGRLMIDRVRPDDLSVGQIVTLFSHEVQSVRRAAWSFAERSLPRISAAMATGVRLLDAKWEDSRQFGFQLFRARMTKAELTPSILVAICDSVRDDVQQFGKELITKWFQDAEGHEYLLALSEHPSEGLQLFATNYLERYAAGSAARLAALKPYFHNVLSRVNRGRVAKIRCHEFLRREALQSREAAEIVVEIMTRQSLSIAIEYRAKAIETMVEIAEKYPDLSVPIRIIPPEARHAV